MQCVEAPPFFIPLTQVETEPALAAADLVYEGLRPLTSEGRGIVKFCARRVVTLDAAGEEIDSTARGDL